MIDFLFVYELKVREWESVVLIGAEMARRGYSVAYCNFPYWNLRALRKRYYNKVRVIAVQSMYDEKVFYNLVYQLVGPVKKVVNLQWEQIDTPKAESEKENYHYPKKIALTVPHLCWGKTPQDNLVFAGMRRDRAPLVGPVQMDFLRPEFNDFYLSKNMLFKKFGIDPSKKTLLFISSFSFASLNEEGIKELQQKLGGEEVEKFRELSMNSQKKFLEWVCRLLDGNTEINFIYRPHPAEYCSLELVGMEERYLNFKCVGDLSVKQWILVCDKVYTWYSTSIAECYFAGVPYTVVRPCAIPEEEDVSIMRDFNFITTQEEFIRSIAKDGDTKRNGRLIRDYYDFDRGTASYLRIAEFLEKIICTEEYDIEIPAELETIFRKQVRHDLRKSYLIKIYEKVIGSLWYLHKNTKLPLPPSIRRRIGKHERMQIKISENGYSSSELNDLEKKLQTCTHREEKR